MSKYCDIICECICSVIPVSMLRMGFYKPPILRKLFICGDDCIVILQSQLRIEFKIEKPVFYFCETFTTLKLIMKKGLFSNTTCILMQQVFHVFFLCLIISLWPFIMYWLKNQRKKFQAFANTIYGERRPTQNGGWLPSRSWWANNQEWSFQDGPSCYCSSSNTWIFIWHAPHQH